MVMMRQQGPYFPGNYPGSQHCPGNNYGGGYGCQPPYMQPWGQSQNYNQTLPDATVGHGIFGSKQQGYGLDLNGDGRYQAGQDGIIGFDKNGDGKLSKKEIKNSNQMLEAFNGDFDLNNDGKTSWAERIKGKKLQKEAQKMDTDHDGRLENNELQAAGAKVGIDRNEDGKCSRSETYDINNYPTPYGRGSLQGIDTRHETAHTHNSNNHCRAPWYPHYN